MTDPRKEFRALTDRVGNIRQLVPVQLGRSAARSATFRALNSDASRAASLSVKVLWSWRGASSRTVSRCALVIVRTRSASEAILDVSCRAAKLDASPPSFSRTSAAS